MSALGRSKAEVTRSRKLCPLVSSEPDIPDPTFREQAVPPIPRQSWILRGPLRTDERTSRDAITKSENLHNFGSRSFSRAQTCQHRTTSVANRPGGKWSNSASYTLALSRWAAIGKASSVLLVYFPKAFLTSVIRASRAASLAWDTGPANGEPAT
jgi:hypothetical protein